MTPMTDLTETVWAPEVVQAVSDLLASNLWVTDADVQRQLADNGFTCTSSWEVSALLEAMSAAGSARAVPSPSGSARRWATASTLPGCFAVNGKPSPGPVDWERCAMEWQALFFRAEGQVHAAEDRVNAAEDRVKELVDAIETHRRLISGTEAPAERLDHELWAVLDTTGGPS